MVVSLAVVMAAALSLAAQSPVADTDAYVSKKGVSAAAAKRALAACEVMARTNHWPMTMAVVDDAGNLVAFLKMDGAALNTIDFALGKANTALRIQAPSTDLTDRLAKGQMQVLNWGLLPGQGGLPIRADDVVIGAMGVSGQGGADDERCAQAGVDAVMRPSR